MTMAGDNFLLQRVTTYAAWATALAGAILALIGCAIAAVAGSPPSPVQLAAIVIGVALASALLSRFLIARIPWFTLGTYAASRIARRAGRRRRKL